MKYSILVLLSFIIFPALGSGWIQMSDFGGVARHRSTGLSIGNKAYMGLGHYNGGGTNILFDDWWEYDPATGAWTQKADYQGGPCYHAAGFTIDNYGYVGTGRISASGSILVQDFYRYNPITNSWNTIASLPGDGRRGAVSFVINNEGYVGTGQTDFGNTSTFYKYSPVSNFWTQTPSLPGEARTSSVGLNIENKGYVGTGQTNFGSINDFWQFSATTNSWLQKSNVGPTNRQEAAGFSLNGLGYIGTGDDYSSGNNFKDIWEYEPLNDTWTQIENFQGTARRYLVAFTHGNYAYAGLGTNGTNFKDFWKFDQTLSILERNMSFIEMNLFPNPTTDILNLRLTLPSSVNKAQLQLEIHDNKGAISHSSNIENGLTQINIKHLKSGVYYTSITYENVILKTAKLIVK